MCWYIGTRTRTNARAAHVYIALHTRQPGPRTFVAKRNKNVEFKDESILHTTESYCETITLFTYQVILVLR